MTTYPMAFIPAPGKIEFREMPLREVAPGEVMIKVHRAAICGSDLHLFRGKHPSAELPAAVGHELSGEVVQIGAGVKNFHEGDRVTVEPVIACGTCYFCQHGAYHLCTNVSFQYRKGQGGFAEYFYSPAEHTFKLADNLSWEEGALIEPLSVALHAVKRSRAGIGQSSAVIGAGAIGLLVALLLHQTTGVSPFISDFNDFRVQRAIDLGLRGVFARRGEDIGQVVLAGTQQLGVDHAFEAVGRQESLAQALNLLKKGGKATLLGIFEDPQPVIPINLFVQREISLSGSQGYVWDFEEAIQLVSEGKIPLRELITSRLPFTHLQQGFDSLMQPGNEQIKVLAEF